MALEGEGFSSPFLLRHVFRTEFLVIHYTSIQSNAFVMYVSRILVAAFLGGAGCRVLLPQALKPWLI